MQPLTAASSAAVRQSEALHSELHKRGKEYLITENKQVAGVDDKKRPAEARMRDENQTAVTNQTEWPNVTCKVIANRPNYGRGIEVQRNGRTWRYQGTQRRDKHGHGKPVQTERIRKQEESV